MTLEKVFSQIKDEDIDEDIREAAELLGLPRDAFLEDAIRKEILKSPASLDVVACPGSGKTTLLVAKLAILAKHWPYRTEGICVLSHTNAARIEIETKLGNTTVGQRLLSYPHFIGTIHGFVDTFVAIPWLRSHGYRITLIDTDIVRKKRWWRLPQELQDKLRGYIKKQKGTRKRGAEECVKSLLTVELSGFNSGSKCNGTLTLTPEEISKIREILQKSTFEEGYFCYQEMLMWGEEAIEKSPGIVKAIRQRFPLLFIDEAQDTGEAQARILDKIFMARQYGDPVIRQRFGDPNQAIYHSASAQPATIDPFPVPPNDPNIQGFSLSNSHRFDNTIAELAHPLRPKSDGEEDKEDKCEGTGPKAKYNGFLKQGQQQQHTIFLFDENSIAQVLPAYAQLILETFSDKGLKEGRFTAVGMVHRPSRWSSTNAWPYNVPDYWPAYDAELSGPEPHPETFVQYVQAGQKKAVEEGEAYPLVEKIAEGLQRLVNIITGPEGKKLHRSPNMHRYILRLIEEKEDDKLYQAYRDLVYEFVRKRGNLTQTEWEQKEKQTVRDIAKAIVGFPGNSRLPLEAVDFLKWPTGSGTGVQNPTEEETNSPCKNNVYVHSENGREVSIHLGSIHSVKGQEHTATLVLETHWYTYNLQDLLDLLIGSGTCRDTCSNMANKDEEDRCRYRCRVHYVAMTRPTHLLCLAMRKEAFGEERLREAQQNEWKLNGWTIKDLTTQKENGGGEAT